jgi:hypothetical protein
MEIDELTVLQCNFEFVSINPYRAIHHSGAFIKLLYKKEYCPRFSGHLSFDSSKTPMFVGGLFDPFQV